MREAIGDSVVQVNDAKLRASAQAARLASRVERDDWRALGLQGQWTSLAPAAAALLGLVATLTVSSCGWIAGRNLMATQAAQKGIVSGTASPDLGIGSTQFAPSDGMVQVYVPAGDFLMGSADSDSQASPVEKPQHRVYLDAYWIDRTDVTNATYAACVAVHGCQPPSATNSKTRTSYYGNTQYADYPVIYVSWTDAQAYCEWAGRRLPTEAEWEKAARGTDGRLYPWGNAAPTDSLLNYNEKVGDTTAVGSYPQGASPYGALDMVGNVGQWVADWYADNYYSQSPIRNPVGPGSGLSGVRVLRGGSWVFTAKFVRAAFRYSNSPAFRISEYIGFRCAR